MLNKRRRLRKRRLLIFTVLLLFCGLTIVRHVVLERDEGLPDQEKEALKQLPSDYQNVFRSLLKKTEDDRIMAMLLHYEKYPLAMLELLDRNPDTLAYVYAYPEDAMAPVPTQLGDEEIRTVPFLYQWDKRWGYQIYGDDLMGFTGCGPTVLSMGLSYLKQDLSITPYALARLAMKKGYYVDGQGSKWELFEGLSKHYNVHCSAIDTSSESIRSFLKEGKLVILSMTPGDFTTTGHFILLSGFYEDDTVIVHDPNSKTRSSKHWKLKDLTSQCAAGWQVYV